MFERFRMRDGGEVFTPPGQGRRHNQDGDYRRHARRRGGAGEIDLPSTIPSAAGDLSTVVSPIPEPSSFLMFAAGAGLVAWIARRKLT